MYKPQQPFNVPAQILTAAFEKINGVQKKTFTDGSKFKCSARSYGGTEKVVNGVIAVEDTMTIETHWRPDIGSGDRIRLLDDGSEWDIITPPENIERRNRYLVFKVRRVKGGA